MIPRTLAVGLCCVVVWRCEVACFVGCSLDPTAVAVMDGPSALSNQERVGSALTKLRVKQTRWSPPMSTLCVATTPYTWHYRSHSNLNQFVIESSQFPVSSCQHGALYWLDIFALLLCSTFLDTQDTIVKKSICFHSRPFHKCSTFFQIWHWLLVALVVFTWCYSAMLCRILAW